MVQYNGDVATYNGRNYRRDKRTGYYLNAGTHKRLHVAVYENEVGEIPKGYVVHHLDQNKDNNTKENLVLMTNVEHVRLHGSLLTDERREQMRDNLINNAIPAAREWHGTDEGKAWHGEHAKQTWANWETRSYKCDYCGTEFETRNHYSPASHRFCSNKCKSAFRRASGVDNVVKICERCGNEYTANKYTKTRFCPNCKGCRR